MIIEVIKTSHDTEDSVGYIMTEKDKSVVYITDTGYINRKYLNKMVNKHLYVIESNHDEVMLMDGPYPRFLKERGLETGFYIPNRLDEGYGLNKEAIKRIKGEL